MRAFTALLVIACPVLVVVPALAGGGSEKINLKTKVPALLDQMMSSSAPQSVDAEWSLLKLGPDALPFLPKADAAHVSIKDRLAAVIATLEDMRPRTWTVERAELPLDDALRRLQDQTKLALRDLRQDKTQSRVKVDFQDATFWQVVESLAAQTHSRIALYQADAQIALVDNPPQKLPVSLHGPFRVTVKRLANSLDVDTGMHFCVLTLELAWEPRFGPYLVEPGAASITAGGGFTGKIPSRVSLPVTEHNAREVELQFPAPPRTAQVLDELRGRFVVTTPIKQHRFEFKWPQTKVQKGTDGVQVTVDSVTTTADRWTVDLTVEHPAAAPHFDSFQKWLGGKVWLDSSSCVFERGAGENLEVLRPDPLRRQIVSATANRVTVRYQFPVTNAGEASNWKLVCSSPGRMVEMAVPYQFQNLPLP
jgi:hypothetical protein